MEEIISAPLFFKLLDRSNSILPVTASHEIPSELDVLRGSYSNKLRREEIVNENAHVVANEVFLEKVNLNSRRREI